MRGTGKAMNRRAYEMRAKVIKAVAHPSRLMMVDALAQGEKCVCELQELVGSDMSTVSRHLGLMKDAGIVTDRKRGQQVFNSLRVPCVVDFLGCVERVLKSAVTEQAKLVGRGGRYDSLVRSRRRPRRLRRMVKPGS